MTPRGWVDLAPDELRGAVQQEAKAVITTAGHRLSTTELVDALFPVAYVKNDGADKTRKAIFKTAINLARHEMAAWVERGAPVKRNFGTIRPFLWRKPEPRKCPHCGGELET